jgi:hypothetical protein
MRAREMLRDVAFEARRASRRRAVRPRSARKPPTSPAIAFASRASSEPASASATKRNLVDDTAPAADELAPSPTQSGSPPSPVPEQGPGRVAGGDRGDENYKEQASGNGLLLASEEEQRPLSEDGAAGLVRLVGRRRLARCAGSIGTSNVGCRGLTPDLATAIQAVGKSGGEAGRTGAVTRITDLPLGRLPAGCRRPTAAPRGAEQAAGAFPEASITLP